MLIKIDYRISFLNILWLQNFKKFVTAISFNNTQQQKNKLFDNIRLYLQPLQLIICSFHGQLQNNKKRNGSRKLKK